MLNKIKKHKYFWYCDPTFIDFDLLPEEFILKVEKWYKENKKEVDNIYKKKYPHVYREIK